MHGTDKRMSPDYCCTKKGVLVVSEVHVPAQSPQLFKQKLLVL